MTFLYPNFLFAAFAIAIPIIIHLFNFRKYKVVYFSNLTFLRNINEETKSKSKLKNLLILIARILTILALVFAFSQPYIKNSNNNKKILGNQVGIYIDNSFSLNSEGKFGQIFELSKNKARSILNAYENNTDFLFLDNNFLSKHQHINNKEIISDFIFETEESPQIKTISEIYSKMNSLFETDNSKNKKLYLISDFQKNICDFENIEADSTLELIIIQQVAEKINNIFIDSLWFEQPFRTFNQEEKLFVKIVNTSTEIFNEIPANLYINDTLKTVSSFNIEANSSQVIELVYTNTQKGILNCKVEISDYPITYDNVFYFSYQISENKKILLINELADNKYINKLFEKDDNFELTNISSKNIQISEFSKYDVLILSEIKELSTGLNTELQNYLKAGGTVFIIPNLDGNIVSYNNFLTLIGSNTISKKDTTDTRIDKINLNSIIYKDVFKEIDENSEYPILRNYFRFNNTISNNINLLEAENKTVVLSSLNYEKGNFYILNIPLDETNSTFAKHQIFVPTLYNIALYSGTTDELYYKINTNNILINNINISNPEFVYISKTDKQFEFIPKIISSNNSSYKFDLMGNITKDGNYYLKSEDKNIKGLSFNYDRKESELEFLTESEISENLKKFGITNFKILSSDIKAIDQEIKDLNEGKKLWKLFIIFALIFILAEILFVKLIN